MGSACCGIPDRDWDHLPARRGAHLLQGSAWAGFQARQGNLPLHDHGPGWSWSALLLTTHGLRVLYAPFGPFHAPGHGDDGGGVAAALASLEEAGHDIGADFVRIEPQGDVRPAQLDRAGAVTAPPVQPVWTRIIQLDGGETALRRGLSKGHRSTLVAATRRGVTVRRTQDPAEMATFLALLGPTLQRGSFHAQPPSYYRTLAASLFPADAAALLIAEHEGKAVAAAIALRDVVTQYYAHAAADQASRRLGAATLLVWQLLLDAGSAGAHRVDLFGVAPPGAPSTHPWSGLSAFKRSFGGVDVQTLGTWELPVHRLRYAAYRAGRRMFDR